MSIALDDPRRLGEAERVLELDHALLRVGDEALGLPVFLLALLRPRAQRLQRLDLVAQLGGPLEVHVLRGLDHLLFEVARGRVFLSPSRNGSGG